MSKENIEILRAIFDALNRGDIDAVMQRVARDAEYDASRALGPIHGVYRGQDEIRAAWQEFAEPWEDQRYDVEAFIEAGDQVVTPFTNQLRGRDGIEVQARVAFSWTMREGAVTRITFYQERKEALEAAGLSE